jgi:3-oxoacyl-[acyl-carrier-protein] synthase-3
MSSSLELQAVTLDPAPASARAAGIVALGSALPEAIVSSDAVAQRIGVPEGWIERRTGIRRRRRAGAGDRVWGLAAAAGSEALAAAELDAEAVDLVLVATLSPDDVTPNAAPLVAHALGATNAGAIDVGAACTGFVSALELGAACIESGRAECVLVVGAEILSRFLDHGDRSTAGLFGDGAGAVVLARGGAGRIGAGVFGCDGAAAEFIRAPRATATIQMNGHETFRRATATLCDNALQTLEANGLALEDIDLFVLHQANGRILSAVAEGLGVGPERVLDVIADIGNTSAASIPLALAHAQRDGRLAVGDRVLLGAVGAGFTWGATVVTWGTP